MGTRKRWTPEQIQYLKDNYLSRSIQDISKYVDHPLESTRDKANSLGLKHPKLTYSFDNHFFKTPNLINSYWSGFIAADGNIHDFGRGRYRLAIKLSSKDRCILDQFQEDINSNHIIKTFYQKAGPTSLVKNKEKLYETISLNINSFRDGYYDLHKNFNITEKKSLTLKPPILNWENSLAYIKGYIDGDGCLSFYKSSDRSKPRLNLSLQGTFEVLDWIKEIFAKIYGSETGRKISQKPNNRVYEYRCNDLKAYIVGERIRKSVDRGLHRKWSNLDKAKSLYDYKISV